MTSLWIDPVSPGFCFEICFLPLSDGIHREERETQRAENWHPHVHKGRKKGIVFGMESETLLSSTILRLEMCQKLVFKIIQMSACSYFFRATNLQVLDGKQYHWSAGTPSVSPTVSLSRVRQLPASPATSWPLPCGRGASRQTKHAKKLGIQWNSYFYQTSTHVTTPEGSIIWFGRRFCSVLISHQIPTYRSVAAPLICLNHFSNW